MQLLEVGDDARPHGQPPAFVVVEHVTLFPLSPLLIAVVHRDLSQVAGIAVGILPHMAAKSVELWRKGLDCWSRSRYEIHNPTCELNKLSGQVHPWFVVVPLVLGAVGCTPQSWSAL